MYNLLGLRMSGDHRITALNIPNAFPVPNNCHSTMRVSPVNIRVQKFGRVSQGELGERYQPN